MYQQLSYQKRTCKHNDNIIGHPVTKCVGLEDKYSPHQSSTYELHFMSHPIRFYTHAVTTFAKSF